MFGEEWEGGGTVQIKIPHTMKEKKKQNATVRENKQKQKHNYIIVCTKFLLHNAQWFEIEVIQKTLDKNKAVNLC